MLVEGAVREYDDAVLASGAIPLDILERQIGEYLAAAKQRK